MVWQGKRRDTRPMENGAKCDGAWSTNFGCGWTQYRWFSVQLWRVHLQRRCLQIKASCVVRRTYSSMWYSRSHELARKYRLEMKYYGDFCTGCMRSRSPLRPDGFTSNPGISVTQTSILSAVRPSMKHANARAAPTERTESKQRRMNSRTKEEEDEEEGEGEGRTDGRNREGRDL